MKFFPKFLCVLTIALSIAACDTEEPEAPVTEHETVKLDNKTESVLIKPTLTRPVLDLSLDKIDIDYKIHNDVVIVEEKNDLFDTLNKQKQEPGFSISGKILTNDHEIEKDDYLKKVDGAQIIILGNFE